MTATLVLTMPPILTTLLVLTRPLILGTLLVLTSPLLAAIPGRGQTRVIVTEQATVGQQRKFTRVVQRPDTSRWVVTTPGSSVIIRSTSDTPHLTCHLRVLDSHGHRPRD